jgi:hypothetical protein
MGRDHERWVSNLDGAGRGLLELSRRFSKEIEEINDELHCG